MVAEIFLGPFRIGDIGGREIVGKCHHDDDQVDATCVSVAVSIFVTGSMHKWQKYWSGYD